MTPEERDTFLREPHTAVLASERRDGRIHAVPVWYLYDGETFRVITERGSVKHRNVAATGWATLCVDERDGSFRYVSAECEVTVSDPVTPAERLALHTHYRGPERAREIVDRGGHERMVMLHLTPRRWLG